MALTTVSSKEEPLLRVLTEKRTLIALGILTLIFQSAILKILWALHSPASAFGLQLTFSSSHFTEIVRGWSPMEMQAYLNHYKFDFIYPFVYGTFLASLLMRYYHPALIPANLNRPPRAYPQLTVLLSPIYMYPFVAAVCDVFENMAHAYLISQWTYGVSQTLVTLSAFASWTKWACIVVSLFFVIKKQLPAPAPIITS